MYFYVAYSLFFIVLFALVDRWIFSDEKRHEKAKKMTGIIYKSICVGCLAYIIAHYI